MEGEKHQKWQIFGKNAGSGSVLGLALFKKYVEDYCVTFQHANFVFHA